MPQFVPIRDLKDMTLISNFCHETQEHIYNLYDKLSVAEADLKAGRVSDIDDAISDIRKKYGLISR